MCFHRPDRTRADALQMTAPKPARFPRSETQLVHHSALRSLAGRQVRLPAQWRQPVHWNSIIAMTESIDSPIPLVSDLRMGSDSLPSQPAMARGSYGDDPIFVHLFDFASDALVVTDAAGSIHLANVAASNLLQTPKSQLTELGLLDLVAQEMRDQFRATLLQLLPSSISRVYKTQISVAQGHTLPALLKVTSLPRTDPPRFLWCLKSLEGGRPEETSSPQTPDQAVPVIRNLLFEFKADTNVSQHLQKLADQLTSLLQAQSFLIYLYEPQREELQLEVAKGFPSIPGTHVKLGEGIIGKAAQDRQPIMMENYDGWTTEAPTDSPPRPVAVVPMLCLDDLVGVMAMARVGDSSQAFTQDDTHLLSLFATLSAMLVQAMRQSNTLEQETEKRRQAEQRLRTAHKRIRTMAAKLEIIREEERKVLARQIHDELGQILTSFKLDLSWLAKNQQAILEKSKDLLKLSDTTIESVQRISTELRPGVLDELGLVGAMELQAQEFQKRSGIECQTTLDADDEKLDRNIATALFRIFQEALTNIARHAHATRVDIDLAEERGHLVLRVQDNGCGIDESQINSGKSIGLIGMRERAEVFGGKIEISGAPGKGTRIIARLPVRRSAGEETK